MNKDEAGETGSGPYDFEHYDVEASIGLVKELAEGLIDSIKRSPQNVKHEFRTEWSDELIQRYRQHPGKPVVRLDDLNDAVIPALSSEARELLNPYWERLVSEFGYDRSMNQFRTLRDVVKGSKVKRWASLGVWRRLEGFNLRELTPFVTAIRASNVGTTRVILNPRLPFNMATPWGTKMIGYRGDVAHATSAFHNMEKELHDDYRLAITNTIGDVPFTTTRRPDDNYLRTNVGVLVTILTSLAGLDNSRKQKAARNPLPSWFFICDEHSRTSGLRALFDAEGSPSYNSVRLSQATISPSLESKLPAWPAKMRFNSLDEKSREAVLSHPPLLLISASLLLYQLGILSYLSPELISHPKHEASAYWNLTIHRTTNMRLFEERIGFLSHSKLANLRDYNRLHKPR